MDLSYILNQLGEEDARWFGAVAPALAQSSIFAQPSVAAMRESLGDEFTSHIYTRGNNPTVEILRKKLAALESPNSLTFEQQDLAAIAAICRARGVRTMCDNSYATPLGQSPLAHGIDLVVHSATKYLNGHSDVVAGVICGSEALMREIFAGPYMTLGAIPSPHDAWLMLRGLRTLGVRMERIGATAAQVIEYLRAHPKVARLHYPQAPDHPQRALTERQLKRGSGLFSVELDTDQDGIERCVDSLRRFLLTVSWGGYESLVFPVAGARDWRGREQLSPVPVNLVRFSIGLEEPEVLIADLEQALARI